MKIYKNFIISSVIIFIAFVILTFFINNYEKYKKADFFKNNIIQNDKIKEDKEIRQNNYLFVDSQKKYNNFLESEIRAIEIYEKVSHSVVNINYYKTEYINYFFDIYPEETQGQGSGVIIDKEGYIITNYHVVGGADKLLVALTESENIYEAYIVGVDPENDLAIIKIKNPPSNLVPITLGNSKNLKIGQKVYAIGNPFGLDRTLTAGIISALGRPIKTQNNNIIENTIQTDASINPGNSGGPLINSSGEMIGINTMIISPSGGSIGLGFAIPVDTAKDVVPDLIKYGYVKRGWIDASFLPINKKIAKLLGYSIDYGLMIIEILKGGEAYKAGLRGGNQRAIYGNSIIYIGGDIIIAINEIPIKEYSDLTKILKNKRAGDLIKVEYLRNNKTYSTNLKLIDKKSVINSF